MPRAATAKKDGASPQAVPTYVSSGELARFLGKTNRWIELLTKEGAITKQARGTYVFKTTVRDYIKHLVDSARQTASSGSADRLRDSRDEQIRIRIAKEDRKLISIDEAEATIDSMTAAFLASLDSIPARVTKDEKERARIREFLDEERRRLSARFAEEAEALRTGVEAAASDEEDDV